LIKVTQEGFFLARPRKYAFDPKTSKQIDGPSFREKMRRYDLIDADGS